jgi:hypothetical protein
MSAGWIAGDVRARGLAAAEAIDVASSVAETPGLETAVAVLGQTRWIRDTDSATSVEAAQRAVFETLIWQLRVLAGWFPSEGVEVVRSCVAWFEIRNIEDRLAYFAGASAATAYELGRLGLITKSLGGTSNAEDIRRLMGASAWGNPGGDDAYAIRMWLRHRWHRRARDASPELRIWADAAAWLFGLRERSAGRTSAALMASTPPSLPWAWRWVTATTWSAGDLWRAEERWWEQVRQEGLQLLHEPVGGRGPALGAVTTLAASARRIATALQVAAGIDGGELDATD